MRKQSFEWINDVESGDRERMRETFPWAQQMADCPQDILYHAEGDVWTHTMMVLTNAENRSGPEDLTIMRLAAMFHDCAKPETTVFEWSESEQRDRVRQPNHARKGADKAWRSLVDAGYDMSIAREVVSLCFWHQRPTHINEQSHAAGRICRYVAEGGRWDRLLELCRSDQSGRISPNVEDGMLALDLLEIDIRELSDNLGYDLMSGEMPDSPEWRVRMGEKWSADPFYSPPREDKNTLTVMSGLPGSGKSTWARENGGDATVISLDQIRSEFRRYKRNQEFEGKCFQEASKRLRQALAAKQDVIWDACCLDERSRVKILGLGRSYDANTRVVSIDDPYHDAFQRNSERENPVPNSVMEGMANSREMVLMTEAHQVLSVRDGISLDISVKREPVTAPQP